jgi:hypothetical protein
MSASGLTLKDVIAVADVMPAEQDPRMSSAYQPCQGSLALLDRCAAQILAVQLDQVERDQHRLVAVALVADQIKHRQSALIGDDRFAVEQK